MSDTPDLPEPIADASEGPVSEALCAAAAEGPARTDAHGPAAAVLPAGPDADPAPPAGATDTALAEAHAGVPADTPAGVPVDALAGVPADTPTGVPAEAPADAPADAQAAPPAAPKAPELSHAACTELLRQHFPALFSGPARPIKLRIHADIQQRAPGVFSKGALSAFFRRYTGSTSYLIALGKSTQRFDLDGQPAGELSEEHRQLARDELARRRNVVREREQQAHAQQQAAQAEQLAARQARAALLGAFERTTLTEANFCALKGLTPEALAEQLAQARQEAAEAPPPRPAFNDRRGPPAGAPRGDGPAPRRDGRGPRPGQRGDGPRPQHPGDGPRPQHPGDGPRPQQRGDGPPRGPRPGGRPGGGR